MAAVVDGVPVLQSNEEKRMPKAYWIVRVSMRDPGRYPDYLAAAKLAFDEYGARFVVRGGAFESMEGARAQRRR